jgi:signal transduction histidine kinase
LGLAFVKEVITRMEGRIELQSEVGKGSCFSIFFTKLPSTTPVEIALQISQ